MDELLEWIYPSGLYCLRCDKPIDRRQPYSLCPDCVKQINWANSGVCPQCGRLLDRYAGKEFCHDCAAGEKPFLAGAVCTGYGRVEREWLHRFKYRNQAWLKEPLGQLLAERIAAEKWPLDCVVPVPLHPSRQRSRSYNQAALLSAVVARRLELPHFPDALLRIKKTEAMSRLSAVERRSCLTGAFGINPLRGTCLQHKAVLLIDDIYTTGSTMSECTKVLLGCGASAVYVAAFAAAADIRSESI